MKKVNLTCLEIVSKFNLKQVTNFNSALKNISLTLELQMPGIGLSLSVMTQAEND